jgi:hypothetical protein
MDPTISRWLGLPDEDYPHCHLHPIYGTGQGNTNSPVIWVQISSRLFDAHTTRERGANFVNPDGSYHLKVFMVGFVDDAALTILRTLFSHRT